MLQKITLDRAASFMKWLSDFVSRGTVVCMIILIGLLTPIVVIQVCFRLFFSPLPWTEELARFLQVWLIFLGAAEALKRGRHIGMRLLIERLGKLSVRVKKWVAIVTDFCILFFVAILIGQGLSYMQLVREPVLPATGIPVRFMYAAVPVSLSLMVLQSIYLLLHRFIQERPD